jgi:transcriptional regulator with XRE-family HTH domain
MPPVPKPKRIRQRHFIREWRLYRGLTQESAAERIGMSRENYSKIERGLVPYDQDVLELAAYAFRADVASLLMRDPTAPESPWSLLQSLKPETMTKAVDVLRMMKIADEASGNERAA